MTVEYRVKQAIVHALDLDIAPEEIGDDDPLFGGGQGLNSMATIEIIVALEKAFGIEVPDEDLRVELFDSVRAMADYVRSKRPPAKRVAFRIAQGPNEKDA